VNCIQALRAQVVPRIADISKLSLELTTKTGYGLMFDIVYSSSELVSDLVKGSPPPVACTVEESDSSDDVMEYSSSDESGNEEPSTEIQQLKA